MIKIFGRKDIPPRKIMTTAIRLIDTRSIEKTAETMHVTEDFVKQAIEWYNIPEYVYHSSYTPVELLMQRDNKTDRMKFNSVAEAARWLQSLEPCTRYTIKQLSSMIRTRINTDKTCFGFIVKDLDIKNELFNMKGIIYSMGYK